MFYQTIVGSWPPDALRDEPPYDAPQVFVARVQAYMQKAIREPKTHTSWVNRNIAYEDAITRFVDSTLQGSGARHFWRRSGPSYRRAAGAGVVNSLSQLVLKLASPGVSDFYQGTETWQLDLADPDNRRPVDFSSREEMLKGLAPWIRRAERRRDTCGCVGRDDGMDRFVRQLLRNWTDARIKMFVSACGLRLKKRERRLFMEGSYVPVASAAWILFASWRSRA